jgi:hypothetical protein
MIATGIGVAHFCISLSGPVSFMTISGAVLLGNSQFGVL